MVETDIDQTQESGQIVLSPNLSARWRTNVYFLYVSVFFALCIGLGFSYAGAWMILPFTGLEILALSGIIYYVAHKCHRIEVIRFNRGQVRVERGYRRPQTSWESETFWTRLVVGEKRHPMHSLRLFLRGRKGQIEIGTFLNDSDKQKLLEELRPFVNVTG